MVWLKSTKTYTPTLKPYQDIWRIYLFIIENQFTGIQGLTYSRLTRECIQSLGYPLHWLSIWLFFNIHDLLEIHLRWRKETGLHLSYNSGDHQLQTLIIWNVSAPRWKATSSITWYAVKEKGKHVAVWDKGFLYGSVLITGMEHKMPITHPIWTHAWKIVVCRIVCASSTLYKCNILFSINTAEVCDINTIENTWKHPFYEILLFFFCSLSPPLRCLTS